MYVVHKYVLCMFSAYFSYSEKIKVCHAVSILSVCVCIPPPQSTLESLNQCL
jgi:hypothetical protein